MSEGASDLVYRHARGLGEGMVKSASGVNELIMVADRDREILNRALEKARERARSEAAESGEDSPRDSDAPGPHAPALLAVQLLEQALEQLS